MPNYFKLIDIRVSTQNRRKIPIENRLSPINSKIFRRYYEKVDIEAKIKRKTRTIFIW